MHKTRYIILRKTPYQDTSLIVAGLSPEFGRLDFLLKGARSTGSKKFPYAELFRELNIEFREPSNSGSLAQMKHCEPLASYDDISAKPENYIALCEYSAFILRHTRPMLESEHCYESFITALKRLRKTDSPEPWLSLAKLTYLYESGFVPEGMGDPDPRRVETLDRLLECALDESTPLPDHTTEYWRRFKAYVKNLCTYHSLD